MEKNWQYVLEQYICRNFLCLNVDIASLVDLKVPTDRFGSSVNICTINDGHMDSIKLLYRNLTTESDLDLIPKSIKWI